MSKQEKQDKQTWIESEEKCLSVGSFTRRAKAFHCITGVIVTCHASIADTFFSIPATTKEQHGFIAMRKDGELEFRPHTDQTLTPAQYREQYKKDRR